MRTLLPAALALLALVAGCAAETAPEADDSSACECALTEMASALAVCDASSTEFRGCSEYRGEMRNEAMASAKSGCDKLGGRFIVGGSCPRDRELLGWCPSDNGDGTLVHHFYYRDDTLFKDETVPKKVCDAIGVEPWCSTHK